MKFHTLCVLLHLFWGFSDYITPALITGFYPLFFFQFFISFLWLGFWYVTSHLKTPNPQSSFVFVSSGFVSGSYRIGKNVLKIAFRRFFFLLRITLGRLLVFHLNRDFHQEMCFEGRSASMCLKHKASQTGCPVTSHLAGVCLSLRTPPCCLPPFRVTWDLTKIGA